jgi:hypothetical protein
MSMKKILDQCITKSLENARNDVMRNHLKLSSIDNAQEFSVPFQNGEKEFIVREQYKKSLPLIRGAVLSVNTYRIPDGETFTIFLKNGEGIGVESSVGIVFLGLKKKQDGRYYLSIIKEKDYQSL